MGSIFKYWLSRSISKYWVSYLLFISTCCWVIFSQITKFFSCVKLCVFVFLTFELNNVKIKLVAVCSAIYSLAEKLVINLFVVDWIKITSLIFCIVSFSSKSTRTVCVYFWTVNSKTNPSVSVCNFRKKFINPRRTLRNVIFYLPNTGTV